MFCHLLKLLGTLNCAYFNKTPLKCQIVNVNEADAVAPTKFAQYQSFETTLILNARRR